MGPELQIAFLQPQHLTAAQNLEARSRDEFGQEYNRGQSILSMFNRGKERINGVVSSLSQRVSILAEFRARNASAAVPPADFAQVYAQNYANEHVELSREALGIAVEQNVNSGWFSNLYSFYQQTGGLRLLGGVGLAAYGYFSGVDMQTAQNYYEAAAVVGGTGLIDSIRDIYLATTTRLAQAGGNVAEIKRRWASTAEGWVSGDQRNPLNPNQTPDVLNALSGEASFALARDLEDKINSEGITRPLDSAGVQRLRETTARVVQDYDLITPTVRARDAAKPARAVRIALAGLLVSGVAAYHLLRPEPAQSQPDCGNVDFSQPDWIYGASIGNPNAHSLTGYAQARLLRHINGSRPDLNSGAGWHQLRAVYEDQAIEFIVDGIRLALPAKNAANLRFLTSDLVEHIGPLPVRDVCDTQIEEIARNAPRKPAILNP